MARASAIITPIVSASAITTGTPRSIRPTSVSAAAMPPRSTSTKNAGPVTMSRNGVTSPRRISLMAQPEVGIEHGLVLADLVGPTIGDLLTVLEHDHAVGDVHDHAHVVLDQRDGRAELAVGVEDEAAHVFLFLDVHPRHRLVQEQERRLGREGPGELHALLQAVGQPTGRRLADGLDLEEVDDALDERAVLELLTPGRAPPDRVEQERAAHLQQPSRHDVVEDAHPLEQRDVLKRAGNAERGDVGWSQMRPITASKENPTFRRVVEAANHVQKRRLSRPVGPDDRQDLARTDLEAHAAQRHQRPEPDTDALDGEQRSLAAGGFHRRASPPDCTAWIRTAARMVPVRPSSYVTCASTSARSRSP